MNLESTHNTFRFMCIFAAIGLTCWCFYEFQKNEDVCEVVFKSFDEDEDSIYPSISIFLPNRYNESFLQTYNSNFTAKTYRSLLKGRFWDEEMMKIDHEKASMKLDDYIVETCLYDSLSSRWSAGNCINKTLIVPQSYFGNMFYTMQFPPMTPMHAYVIKLKTSIFENSLRPPNSVFMVQFSYPNQMYRSAAGTFFMWQPRNNQSLYYKMVFTLKSMEVLQRRHKRNQECHDIRDFDAVIREAMIQKVGCQPVFWKTNTTTSMPICNTQKSYSELAIEHANQLMGLNTRQKYPTPPCRELAKFQIDYAEEDIKYPNLGQPDTMTSDGDAWFEIEFMILTNTFKEIIQTRKYSLQSLVGNAGGYCGLCIGYSIMNLPPLIADIWKYIMK